MVIGKGLAQAYDLALIYLVRSNPARHGSNSMSRCSVEIKIPMSLFLGLLLWAPLANGQGAKTLLQIQRLRAELQTDTNAISNGRNAYDSGFKGSQLLDVSQYPNSASCVVVYDDGKYFLEKREDRGGGKLKARSTDGALSADDLQHLMSILDDEALKKITTPKAPDLPPQAQVLKEAERLDVLVGRGEIFQQFSFMKERVKTGADITGSSLGGMSGTDTFLDSGAPYKKTVSPLVKWFDDLGKKNHWKESKPQYCR